MLQAISKHSHYVGLGIVIIVSIFLIIFFAVFQSNGSTSISLTTTQSQHDSTQQFSSILKDIGTATTGKLFKVTSKPLYNQKCCAYFILLYNI